MNKFTAIFERDGDWWIGYVEELPGANTQGRTLPEARENLKEAVEMIIEANRELARLEIGSDAIREIAGGGMNEAPFAFLKLFRLSMSFGYPKPDRLTP